MINLYDKKCTEFNNNGICILKPLECIVTEELNGDYSIQLTLPQSETMVEEESIIKVPVPTGTDIFRVYSINTTLNGTKTVNARHISYDMLTDFIEDTRPTDCNGSLALSLILKDTKFKGSCDIDSLATSYYEMTNPINALIGADNSFINRWGGELERSYYMVNVWSRVGSDRGVTIRYGKNLTGLDLTIDMSEVITRIMPTGVKESNSVLKLPEKYIDSPLIGNYANVRTKRIHYTDISISDDVTQEQAYSMLRNAAKAEYDNGLDKPTVSGQVDFIALQNTEEYKDVEVLESVYLGDTITVYHPNLNVNLTSRVVSYQYDAISQRYINVTLGSVLPIIGASNSNSSKPIVDKVKTETSELKQEFDRVTDAITGQTGGNVVLNPKEKPREFLIMDKDSISTARNIWRWNLAGLAHSKYGYNGPYGQAAITADGQICADFITTGSLSAGIVKSGSFISRNGRLIFNLDGANMTVFDASNNKLMVLNSSGQGFYDGDRYIGYMGRSQWKPDPSKKGIAFNLETEGDYLTWGYRKAGASEYTVQFIYTPRGDIGYSPGLQLGCNLYSNAYYFVLDKAGTTETVSYSNGGGIRTTNGFVVCKKTGGTDDTIVRFNADGNVEYYRNLDMHGYSILNQSDVRLKTNIQNTDVYGLDIINALECKKFDWIESGEHQKIGLIAQQVEKVEPSLVDISAEDGHYSLKTVDLVPYLIKAVQELSEQVKELQGVKVRKTRAIDNNSFQDILSIENKKQYVNYLKEKQKLMSTEQKPLEIRKETKVKQ